jgi:hypothetical protein
MLRYARGVVSAHRSAWPGVVRFRARLEDGAEVPVLGYPELSGTPLLGERVLLNTTALERGLGTGGDALLVARLDELPEPPRQIAGHMVKARYTPLQTMVDALDDPAGEHHAVMSAAEDLEGMPVVAADLHSSLPAIIAGARLDAPGARIALVHTDGAALPAAYSATAAALRDSDHLAAVISAGQSFGGDLEAVTIHSALLGARHVVGADLAIAVQGPGNLGSGTPWGFSGVQAAEALHAATALGGRPVASLRVSQADPRPRHRGLSHHSSTAFGRALLASVVLPLPLPDTPLHSEIHTLVREQLETTVCAPAGRTAPAHEVRQIPTDGIAKALEQLPVRLSTMGRSLEEDFCAFLYAAIAGRAAAALIPPRGTSPAQPPLAP